MCLLQWRSSLSHLSPIEKGCILVTQGEHGGHRREHWLRDFSAYTVIAVTAFVHAT